jgi:hypothetical protein
MAEWLKAHAWKACVRETVPWVRIPLSPPENSKNPYKSNDLNFIPTLEPTKSVETVVDRFRMSDSAPAYALLIAVAAFAVLILIGAAVVHWLP